MASEHPDTIECNSLSAEESATTRWVRLEAYARLLLMKCTAQLVLLLWLLLAAQSASEKVSTTQKHSAPCFQRPCPNSGGISLIPKSPEPLRYPTSFRNLCNAQRVGHDMEAATSFTLNIKSGSVPSQVQKQTHYAPESTCIFCCKAWGGIFVLDSCITRDLLNFCNTKRFLKASHHFLCCCSWHNHDSIIKFYHASFEEGDAVTCLFHHTAAYTELFRHRREKLFFPKTFASTKQEVINMYHENVVATTINAFGQARLFNTPCKTKRITHKVSEVPVPCLGSPPLSWQVPFDQVPLVI